MRTVQDGLYRHEGAINRFGIEEKGTVILAAFGLPPLDHPDDAIRALLSARDIVTELGEIGHKAVIGIATGFVFVGPMGNEIRSEYTMHGNVVNLAARLMQASDSIYCDQATYEKVLALTGGDPVAAHGLRFEALAPMKVKGHDKPVNAYRLQIP
jgi:class 3 adenylate cyclase